MTLVQYGPALTPVAVPVCSICIANYNGVEILAECIESVLTQQGDAPVEVIIHDDASTDDSVAWIRQRYPNVELLTSTENVGFCVANNRLVAQARGQYVLLLNNDAALFPDALTTLLEDAARSRHPGIFTLPQYDWQSGELVDRGCLLDPFYNPVPNLNAARTDVAMSIGACLFLPRAVWNELGGFPERFGSVGEDLYLCCLARMRAIPVQVTSQSGYRHRQGNSFGGNRVGSQGVDTTYRRRALSERNKTTVLFVCTPTPLVWVLVAVHAILLAAEGGILAVLKREPRIWQEIYGPVFGYHVRHFTHLRRLRRHIQHSRQVSLKEYLRVFVGMPRKLWLLRRHGIPAIR